MLKFFIAKFIKKIQISSIKKSTIHGSSKVEADSNINFVEMGKYSFCGYGCDINYAKIGSYTSIANNVIIGGGMHPLNWVAMSPVFYEGRDSVKKKFSEFNREPNKLTMIGNDVWIGATVKIKQGVKIGNGAVVGMGAVVTKDVDDYAIVAGNPAKLIRYRFDEQIREDLLRISWWNLTEEKLERISQYIKEPKKFIKAYDSL